MNSPLTICLKDGKIDAYDGKHSMSELYECRCHLFIKLMRAYPEISWRAIQHTNSPVMFPDKFLAGMELPNGQITFHIPNEMWRLLDACGVDTMEKSPKWDGHGSADVMRRLMEWDNDRLGA